MAIYVDALRKTTPIPGRWPFNRAAHLLADDLDELHAFAERLGCRRAWFQDGVRPHYDLSPSRHARALALGAKLVGRAELVAVLRQIRSGRSRYDTR